MTKLKSNHPPAAEFRQDYLLFGPVNDLSHSYFHKTDQIIIAKAAFLTEGVGGSSYLDADQFRHTLLNKKFKTEAKELREQSKQLL